MSVSVVYGLNSLYFKAQSLFTQHLLMAKYNGKAIIPPDGVRRDFFWHLTPPNSCKLSSGDIALPSMRIKTSQKCAKGIHLQDLAAQASDPEGVCPDERLEGAGLVSLTPPFQQGVRRSEASRFTLVQTGITDEMVEMGKQAGEAPGEARAHHGLAGTQPECHQLARNFTRLLRVPCSSSAKPSSSSTGVT